MFRNEVHIEGIVKRDSEAAHPRPNVSVMSFCLAVPDPMSEGADVYVDCFAATEVVEQLDGFVSQGEALAVDGQLSFRTMTDYKGRRRSAMVVCVKNVEEIEG